MTPNPSHGAALGTSPSPTEHSGAGRWTRKRRARSSRPAGAAPRTHPVDARDSAVATPELEELWDSHAQSVYTLACTLLGDEEAAAQAVRLAMTDLACSVDSALPDDAHRSWSRHVYLRSQQLADEASQRSTLTPFGELDQPRRTCLALSLFGGHTCREVASLLGMAPTTVAEMLTSGLRDVRASAAGGTAATA